MNIISHISRDFLSIFKKQIFDEKIDYHKSIYLKYLKNDNGYLIYNILTSELIFIDEKEYNDYNLNKLKNRNFFLYHFLIEHWFLIPNDYNEKMMVYLYRNMKYKKPLISEKQNTYVILTTTDCNARCYYCFELGTRRVKMTEKTAVDVANYIIKKSDHSKPIHLAWFGGEPLFNSDVIDLITSHLKSKNLKYESSMISNGYLFDENLVNKAKNEWNLKRIQITLDGTAEIYNKTKAYIYHDDLNPFSRILNNIEKLSQSNILVHIRCNLSLENFSNLHDLIDVINERFSETDKKNIWVYFNVLYEMNGMTKRTYEEEMRIYDELYELEKYSISKGLYSKEKINLNKIGLIKHNHCMADSPDSVLISPEGKLGSCEHFTDSNFHASIYDENSFNHNYNLLRDWKKKKKEQLECLNCCHYPNCYTIEKCEVALYQYPFCFNKLDRKIERAMINTYEIYKKEKEMK